MDNDDIQNKEELAEELFKKLDILQPSTEEMIYEIRKVGLSIRLDNADIRYIEKHKKEIIVSMWKVVRVAQMINEQNININLTSQRFPRIKKGQIN